VKVAAKRRLYFFDVKEEEAGAYFAITETKKEIHNGSFRRVRLIIDKDDVGKFKRGFEAALIFLSGIEQKGRAL